MKKFTVTLLSLTALVSVFPFFVSCGKPARKNSGVSAPVVPVGVENVKFDEPQVPPARTGPQAVTESAAPLPGGPVIEIKEKMFIAQTNDVYLNPDDYMGKTIRLEGLFKLEQSTEREAPYCFVIRYGPGCCGYDGSAGFEVAWNRPGRTWPAGDEWVAASGVLKTYEEDGVPYLYLDLASLAVMDRRGAEFVTQ